MSEMDLHEDADVPGGGVVDAGTSVTDDPEAPEADALEQRTDGVTGDVTSTDAGGSSGTGAGTEAGALLPPDEVDPADRAEQERPVESGDDDYR